MIDYQITTSHAHSSPASLRHLAAPYFLRVFAASRESCFLPHAKPRRARRIADDLTQKESEAAILWFEKGLGS